MDCESRKDLSLAFSCAAHLAFLAAAWLAVPPIADAEPQPFDATMFVLRAGAITADAEVEPGLEPPVRSDADDPDRGESRCGELHGGTMGDAEAAKTALRYGVEGPPDNPDPHLAYREARYAATWMPIISPSPSVPLAGGTGPTVRWGREESLGNDLGNARGGMYGEAIGAAFGSPGAGIGRRELCPTCGGRGVGTFLDLPTAPGGATATERAHR